MTQALRDAPLVEAVIDRDVVGDNWPAGLVQLIEAHEKKHRQMVYRKDIHVLIDRYVERYFSDVTIGYEHRRFVIRMLRRRYSMRLNRHFTDLLSPRRWPMLKVMAAGEK